MINKILLGVLYFVSTVKAGCFWVVLYAMVILSLGGALWAAWAITQTWRW